MKTFYEFVDHKKLENSIVEAANLMVEMDIDPQTFILDYVSKYPDMEEKLQEGLFGNLLKGAGKFASNVWNGGGITGGWAQAKDTVMGPGAKFDDAVKTLTDLAVALHKNDQTRDMKTSDGTKTIARYIAGVVQYLRQQKDMIPRMQPAANTQPTFSQRGAGTPSGGTPSGGTPSGGTPAGGTPTGGTPAGGTPAGGPSPPPTT